MLESKLGTDNTQNPCTNRPIAVRRTFSKPLNSKQFYHKLGQKSSCGLQLQMQLIVLTTDSRSSYPPPIVLCVSIFPITVTTFPLYLSAVNPKSELCCCRKTIYPVIMSHQTQLVGSFYAVISRTESCLILNVNGLLPGIVWMRWKNYKLVYCLLYLSVLTWLGIDVESRHSRKER